MTICSSDDNMFVDSHLTLIPLMIISVANNMTISVANNMTIK
jgi:hypothetical protein